MRGEKTLVSCAGLEQRRAPAFQRRRYMRGWGQTDKRERGPCCPCWLVVSLHGDEPLASCAHRGSCCPAAPTWAPLCSGSICFPACPSFSRPSLLPPSRRTSQFPTLQRGVGLGKRFACVFSLSTSWVILQNHFGLLSGLYFLCFFLSLSLKLRSTESLWFFGGWSHLHLETSPYCIQNESFWPFECPAPCFFYTSW